MNIACRYLEQHHEAFEMSAIKSNDYTKGQIGVLLDFFFNDTATTEIYTLSLHDALPPPAARLRKIGGALPTPSPAGSPHARRHTPDRKSTRLNSSHPSIPYAVFCLKKKKKQRPRFVIKIKKQKRRERRI